MRSLRNWLRREVKTHTDEARAHLAKASQLEARADRLIAHERKLIRENHFGPRIAAALREEMR